MTQFTLCVIINLTSFVTNSPRCPVWRNGGCHIASPAWATGASPWDHGPGTGKVARRTSPRLVGDGLQRVAASDRQAGFWLPRRFSRWTVLTQVVSLQATGWPMYRTDQQNNYLLKCWTVTVKSQICSYMNFEWQYIWQHFHCLFGDYLYMIKWMFWIWFLCM